MLLNLNYLQRLQKVKIYCRKENFWFAMRICSADLKKVTSLWVNKWSGTFDLESMEKAMAPTPVLLPGKSHGRRSLEGCSPWGRWGSDTTEWLHFHFSLSCIREGNGNPLQCSCLENPRDGGAWWAAIYGVAQSRTRLKWLSSSSSSMIPQEKVCRDFGEMCQKEIGRIWGPTGRSLRKKHFG